MLFRNQRGLAVMFGREGWLRPAMSVPEGDTGGLGGRKQLMVAGAGLYGHQGACSL